MTVTPALRTPWTPSDYVAAGIVGSGGRKLADSGVAPLVASARGYLTVNDDASLKTARTRRGKVRGRPTKQEAYFARGHAHGEDALFMPWFSPADPTTPGAAQWRPSHPKLGPSGKAVKYLFAAGERLVLDAHPATPDAWAAEASAVLIVEGIIKADSALTQVLLSANVKSSQLSASDDRSQDLARLRALMEQVPARDGLTIVAVGGVGTWHQSPEWSAVRLRRRTVYVAFDGDIRTNRAVHAQAEQLERFLSGQSAAFNLIDLGGEKAAGLQAERVAPEHITRGPDGSPKRLGLDDFLATVGSWTEALGLRRETLPELEEDAAGGIEPNAERGEFRVDRDGCGVSEYRLDTVTNTGYWQPRARIAGRVVSIETSRAPGEIEQRTGFVDPLHANESDNTVVTLELQWRDEDGEVRTETLRGPIDLLLVPPGEWLRRKALGEIPSSIALNPHFPPANGEKWLSAIKAHRSSETEQLAGWTIMGYVPTKEGRPAYIVGSQVVATTPEIAAGVRSAITDRVLPGAGRYGVDDSSFTSYPDPDEYRSAVQRDIRELIANIVTGPALASEAVKAVAIATMFRPTLPIRPDATLSIYGPPGRGKSWVAGMIMSAWQSRPDTWDEKSLPGQAGDTFASTEGAIAQTNIWVSDDLAASADPRQAVSQEASMGSLIRAVQNGEGKRRSSIDLTQREVNKPRAQFITTAENEMGIMSVRDRCLSLEVAAGVFGSEIDAVGRLKTWWKTSMVPARLSAALIRMWLDDEFWLRHPTYGAELDGRTPTWAQKLSFAADMRAWCISTAKQVMLQEGIDESRLTRHAENAANFTVALLALRQLALWSGIPEDDPIVDVVLHASGARSLARQIQHLAAETIRTQANTSPGLSLLHALSNGLRAKRFHIMNPDTPGAPPFLGNDLVSMSQNTALGWEFDATRGESGAWVPKGVGIGYAVERERSPDADGGEVYLLLSYENAFNEAKRFYPTLLPGGVKGRVSWMDLNTLGLLHPAVPRREGSPTTQVRTRSVGSGREGAGVRHSGVPVPLSTVLDPESKVGVDAGVPRDLLSELADAHGVEREQIATAAELLRNLGAEL